MSNRKVFSVVITLLLWFGAVSYRAQAQSQQASNTKRSIGSGGEIQSSQLLAQTRPGRRGFSLMASGDGRSVSVGALTTGSMATAPNLPVLGSGMIGRLTKWTGLTSTNSFAGASIIFEDKNGLVGIGTDTPTSRVTVAGMIETTLGGYKFPDGTVQTTGGIPSVSRDTTLTGSGTAASPLGIAPGGVGTLQLANGSVTTTKIAPGQVVKTLNGLSDSVSIQPGANITVTPLGNTLTIAAAGALSGVAHDATLKGNGASGSPLGVNVPLVVSGSFSDPLAFIFTAVNTGDGGNGMKGVGGSRTNPDPISNYAVAGDGVSAVGGDGLGLAIHGGAGIRAEGGLGPAAVGGLLDGAAGVFIGGVEIAGGDLNLEGGASLNVTGTKNFKIDHPLDPENKYLYHAAIESSEVLNVYSGNITTNENGEAAVTFPDWFEAINRDFRYQLTVVGQFAQAIVASRIKSNRFTIKTNAPNVEVSWQVTGVRSDAGMLKHPFKTEEEKPERERGYYLGPELYGQPEERGIEWARNPEMMQQRKLRRAQVEEMLRNKQKEN